MPTEGTYRAIKLRTLPATTFDYVVDADLRTCEGLFPRATRATHGAMLAFAVAVVIAIDLSEAPVRAVSAALCRRAHALAD